MKPAERAPTLGDRILRWHAENFIPGLMQAKSGVGPDFLCIGCQKAGTQWLYDQLRPHPDFWMPPIKELRYFSLKPEDRGHLRRIRGNWDKMRNWNRRDLAYLAAANWISWREPDFDEYARLFNPKSDKLAGDVNPDYTVADDALVESFAKRFPALRVILLVRDPVERFWSSFSMGVRYGWYAPVDSDDDWPRVQAAAEEPYMRALSYASEIALRWQRFIPAERFATYLFDEIKTDPAAVRSRAISFLGADPSKRSGNLPASFNRKASHRKETMSDGMRKLLARHFADEIRACAATFGGAAASWPAKYGL